jgi:dolichyl-phosphate beta-glucosyltransferase
MTALSIVIPAYNEATRLGPTLARVAAYAPTAEIIVVDDGSHDDTAGLARAAGVRLVQHPHNRGKGAAVRTGSLAAHGARILICDADLATPIEDLALLQAALDAGADLAIGSRHAARAHIAAPQPFARRVLGAGFRSIVRHLMGLPVHDAMCGFKLLRREAALDLLPRVRTDRFAFDVELLTLARRARYRVTEIPVTWRHIPGSRVSITRDGLQAVRDLLAIRRRR